MHLTVLGCSGSMAAGCRTTALLLDDDILLDAGTGIGDLELDALARIDDVLLTHSHLDHVLGIPLMVDSTKRLREGRGPLRVHALRPTLEALRQHVFNDVIWPDFTRLPTQAAPMLTLHPIAVGDVLTFRGGRRIEVLPAVHTVPACGFAVHAAAGLFVYTGDTAPNPALWERLRGEPLQGLIIETAFRDDESKLANLSRHLHPSALVQELRQVDGGVPVYVTHVKPGELEVVMAEVLARTGPRRVQALRAGERLALTNASRRASTRDAG